MRAWRPPHLKGGIASRRNVLSALRAELSENRLSYERRLMPLLSAPMTELVLRWCPAAAKLFGRLYVVLQLPFVITSRYPRQSQPTSSHQRPMRIHFPQHDGDEITSMLLWKRGNSSHPTMKSHWQRRAVNRSCAVLAGGRRKGEMWLLQRRRGELSLGIPNCSSPFPVRCWKAERRRDGGPHWMSQTLCKLVPAGPPLCAFTVPSVSPAVAQNQGLHKVLLCLSSPLYL